MVPPEAVPAKCEPVMIVSQEGWYNLIESVISGAQPGVHLAFDAGEYLDQFSKYIRIAGTVALTEQRWRERNFKKWQEQHSQA